MGTRRRALASRGANPGRGLGVRGGGRYFIYRPPLGYLETVRSDMCGSDPAEPRPDLVVTVLGRLMAAADRARMATSSLGRRGLSRRRCQHHGGLELRTRRFPPQRGRRRCAPELGAAKHAGVHHPEFIVPFQARRALPAGHPSGTSPTYDYAVSLEMKCAFQNRPHSPQQSCPSLKLTQLCCPRI